MPTCKAKSVTTTKTCKAKSIKKTKRTKRTKTQNDLQKMTRQMKKWRRICRHVTPLLEELVTGPYCSKMKHVMLTLKGKNKNLCTYQEIEREGKYEYRRVFVPLLQQNETALK